MALITSREMSFQLLIDSISSRRGAETPAATMVYKTMWNVRRCFGTPRVFRMTTREMSAERLTVTFVTIHREGAAAHGGS